MNQPIVFFGSGPVAARSLELLYKFQTIEAIVTKTKAKHHHGSVPVLDVAEKLNIPVIEVSTRDELDSILPSKDIKSKLAILIDFGIIVSQKIIDYFPLGIVNSHFSLLPEWRGADPITFAVLSGQKMTGVSLMLLVQKMDEGPILAQKSVLLTSSITTPELTSILIDTSNDLLKENIRLYFNGKITLKPQDTSIKSSYSHKLKKTDGIIKFNKTAIQLEREVRAFSDWPGSKFKFKNIEVTITKAHVVECDQRPGEIIINKKNIIIACKKGGLAIDFIKPDGKKEMPISAFIAGYRNKI